MNDIWTKAAAAAFVMLATVAGWGLKKVYDVDMRTIRIEERLEIWMTPSSKASFAGGGYEIQLASYSGAQGLDFAQKAMIRAADKILEKDPNGAFQTLLVGLEQTGLKCAISDGRLACR